MKNTIQTLKALATVRYFEGEEEKEAPKTFTQEEVNAFLADDKRKYRAEAQQKADSLIKAQEAITMTQEERDIFAAKVEELTTSLSTKDELTKRDKAKLEATAKAELENAKSESALWKGRFEKRLIEASLLTASSKEGQKAFNPNQIVQLFERDASVVTTEDGKDFEVRVAVNIVNDKGKSKTLSLSAADAIKEYASMASYANLFDDGSKEGLGRKQSNFSFKKGALPTTMAEYKAAREGFIK